MAHRPDRLRWLHIPIALLLALQPPLTYALPQGGQVSGGQAVITSGPSDLTINQASQRAVIDWSSFNIGSGEAVRFNQPSASAIALNRIHDSQASQIEGRLSANGQVWLVNANGILFGNSAQVNVGGLLATSSDIANDRFMNGDYRFDLPGNPFASILNRGRIHIADGGLAALVGPNVTNSGLIEARLGKVQLASGDKFTLDLYGDGLINLQASGAITQQLVSNSGSIVADGGSVLLTTAAAESTINGLINMDGLIEADTIGSQTGQIMLYAEGSNAVPNNVAADKGQKTGNSTVLVSGTLDASGLGTGAKGGTIEVLGDHVGILSGASLDASGAAGGGTLRIGGATRGGGNIPAAKATLVQGATNLYANATDKGDGGTVTVWADDYTNFAGHIEARGGRIDGNGGFVETSGKQALDMSGSVNASSPWGRAGLWLMDPNNATINGSATSNPGYSTSWTAGAGGGNVLNTDINNSLNGGTSVSIIASGDITVSSAISKTAGGNATLTLQADNDITVNAAITSNTNKLGMVLNSDHDASGAGGIKVAANLTSNGGNITMGGGADPTATNAIGETTNVYGVEINGATVNAGGGNIILRGTGYASGSSKYGVYLHGGGGGIVQTSGSGTIDITGNGGGSGAGTSNYGVYLTTSGSKISGAGTSNITGSGGSTTGGNDRGIQLDSGTVLETTGAGTLTVTGNGGGSGTSGSDIGLYVNNGTIRSTASGGGGLTIHGTAGDAGGSGTNSFGMYISGASALVTSVDGAISITGDGNTSSGSGIYGIDMDSGGIVSSTGIAPITLHGNGGGTGSGGGYGITLQSSNTKVTSVTGHVEIIGTGSSTPTSGSNHGLYINGASVVESTGVATLDITGNGGGSAGGGGMGIEVTGGGIIRSTAASGGSITLHGTAGDAGGSLADNYGVYLTGANTLITSKDGDVNITGNGNTSSGARQDGIVMTSTATVSSTGNAGLTLTGNGGGGAGTNNDGVYVSNSTVTSATGTVTVNGTGGTGSGGTHYGVYLTSAGAVTSTGAAPININGVGGSGGASDYGIDTVTGSNVIGGASATGKITLTADTLNLANLSVQTTDNITLAPYNANTTVGVAGGAGTLNVSTTVLGFLNGGSYTVGRSDGSVAMTVNGYTWGAPATLETGSGALTIAGVQTMNANALTLQTDSDLALTGGANSISGSGALTIKPSAAGTSIGLAGGAGTLNLSAGTDLPAIKSGWGSIVIGASGDTSALTANAYTWNAPLTLYGGSGGLAINGAQTMNGNTFLARTYSSGDITFGASGSVSSTASNTAITLVSNHNFVNNNGSGVLSASNGRWLVYSTNPANDTINSLSNDFRRFSCTYGGSCPSFPGTGNGFLYTYTPSLTVTPNAASTTYASAAPAFGYALSGYLGSDSGTDTITGAPGYSTPYVQGNNAGSYNITATVGTLASALGYGFSGATRNNGLTVNPYTLSVTAAAKSKTYGASDPALTYTYGSLQNGDNAGVFSGGLTRAAGETVAGGPYAIAQGTLSAGSNYSISYTGANLTINPYTLSVTAAAKSKTYGASDPALTYTYGSLQNGDNAGVFSGALSRAAGETVAGGPYAIGQGTLSAGSNYSISYTGANLTINPYTLSVTADAKSKTYGASDPALTYTYGSLQNGDNAGVFSGALSRAAGETVAGGPYAIAQGTLSAGSNYSISYTGANLTINPYTLSVTAAAKSKTYGASDPALTYTYGSLQNGDNAGVFSGGLTRAAGETVAGGPYAIAQGTLSAGSNYSISYTGANLTINPYTLSVTAAAKSKTYGASDPALTYTYGSLQNGDNAGVFSGGLTRAAGETVAGGPYAIGQGTLSAGSNYSISYTGANLTINPYTLSVTADAKSKTYGASDPALTYTYGSLQNGDNAGVFSGALSRAAGETVAGGPYAIGQGTLSAGSNYSISYTGANLTINPYTLSVTAAAKSKTYGASDPALTYTYGSLQNGDNAGVFSGGLTRAAGETVAGGPYAIGQGTLSAGSNYSISYTGANLTINPYTLSVTADAKSKTYGASDPALTYTYGSLQNGDNAGVFSGGLTRAAGETVAGGPYAIGQGTLSAGGNYSISYTGANLTINPYTLSVTAAAKSKTYGAADPALTYAYGALQNGDNAGVFSGGLTRAAGETVAGGPYAIAQGTLSAGSNYSISYTGANLTINPYTLSVTAAAKSKTYGAADPALTYTYGSLQNGDNAGVFSGGLTRAAGETVAGGPYAIGQGSLSAGGNYSISYTGANLTINPYTLSVTAAAKSKTYGAADPALTYAYGALQNGDNAGVFSGGLTRAAGETVAGGPYAIAQGTLSAGSNYSISYTGANLTINPYTLSVTAAAKSKTYGAADPALTYTYGSLQNGDNAGVFSGGLTRAAGETVAGGPYAIGQGTLSAGSNYSISYTGANLTINPYTLSVTADAKSKTYGAADPALTYTYGSLQNGDTSAVFSGALSRAAGETVAGGPYAIAQGTLSAGSNYSISYTGANLTINPTPGRGTPAPLPDLSSFIPEINRLAHQVNDLDSPATIPSWDPFHCQPGYSLLRCRARSPSSPPTYSSSSGNTPGWNHTTTYSLNNVQYREERP